MQLRCVSVTGPQSSRNAAHISHINTHHIIITSHIMQYHNKCHVFSTGVTLGGESSHLLVSFNFFKPCQPQLASWISTVRAVAFAFEFQASDGSEEQALKSPFEAAVRIKAGWLLNGLPNLSHYIFWKSWRIDLSYIYFQDTSHTSIHMTSSSHRTSCNITINAMYFQLAFPLVASLPISL